MGLLTFKVKLVIIPKSNTSRKKNKLEIWGEFRKIWHPTFDGERKGHAEEILLNITKYFQVYEYGSNLKYILEIYELQGKSAWWLEHVKIVHTL